MPPRSVPSGGQRSLPDLDEMNRWVTVSWMPHASLSQSSNIAFSVRSIVLCLDLPTSALKYRTKQPEDWRVQITIHGCAGLDVVPVSSMTANAPLMSISDHSFTNQQKENAWNPLVSSATHLCRWDSIIYIPLRWRDLLRDAYLKFQVLGPNDNVVRFIFFKVLRPMCSRQLS
jgi:hypothetical protein